MSQKDIRLRLMELLRSHNDSEALTDVPSIQFALAPSGLTPAEGLLYWNPDDGTLNIGMPGSNVNLQVGQEILRRVYNDTGAQIDNGQLVYISGSTGEKLKISLAKADDIATSSPRTIYMATENIPDKKYGYVNFWGDVRDVNTLTDSEGHTLSEGEVLYLSATVAGGWTNVPPESPNMKVKIGGVLKKAEDGIITISQLSGCALARDNQTDFTIGPPADQPAFDATGHQTMKGDARPWRDELSDAINLKSQGVGVSVNATESVVEFIHTAQMNDYLFANVQLNHDRDPISEIHAHIHFFQAENAVPNFMLQYRWQINGGAKTTAWTPIKCNTLAFPYSSGTIHQIAGGANITPPVGTQLSDIIQFRVIRDHDNASTLFTGEDPYTATVGVLAFDIHFQTNSIGSTDEYTK